uniref:protein spaetzle 4 isoform X2 n=1 Tax=Vespula vulgaris TaxID=7454 RepID=UPI00223BBD57|nr:protein spaetzle 4 isoform X2 [Vespula vulgaris]XP_050848287.1 protein spaetzle 4 isoform X2 [Vespula vulgaris]
MVAKLTVIRVQLVRCQGNGGGGGGPSTFGYDASSACSKPYSRAGRTIAFAIVNLPCDFRRQSWCTIAGSSYPWHAVRRFVQENQGLMRRMYGDEKYINVLKAEFEKNDIELKYDDYYHHFSDDSRGYQYEDEFDPIEDEERILRVDDEEYGGRSFTSRSFNDPTTKRFGKFPKLNEYSRLRATDGSSTSTTTMVTSSATSTTTSSSTIVSSMGSTTTPVTSTMVASTIASSSSVDVTTKEIDSTQSTTLKKVDNEVEEKNETVTHSQIVREQNLSINEISGQVDRIDEKIDEKVKDKLEEPAEQTEVPELDIEDDSNIESLDAPTSSTVFTEDSFDVGKETTIHETFVSDDQQKFRPRPEYRPSTRPATVNMEGQLYQDVAAKDQQQEQPVLKLRGVNACPVKEEVVAPFWANNTRGEVLALLNLYPFEQYVHWEKCTHENKQMYCRDGCRCEQQYRLHRLLAYDPNNECRGIFSDWFKFPSCCVCRCYDLPLEFRVTSRSPRTQKQRLRVQPPRSRFS